MSFNANETFKYYCQYSTPPPTYANLAGKPPTTKKLYCYMQTREHKAKPCVCTMNTHQQTLQLKPSENDNGSTNDRAAQTRSTDTGSCRNSATTRILHTITASLHIFTWASGVRSQVSTAILLCGHLLRHSTQSKCIYVCDIKCTVQAFTD